MIVLFNPKACRPHARRFPLSIMHLGAMLNDEDYVIVDGNVDQDPVQTISNLIRSRNSVELLAVTVMPGPQFANALPQCKKLKALFPELPMMWGGYFPSMHHRVCLQSNLVDLVVRGQGEHTLLEYLSARCHGAQLDGIQGLCHKRNGDIIDNGPRPMVSPNELPEKLPYHKIDPEAYIHPTFLGRRTATHHVSIGCPFNCNFCGVISVYGSQEKLASPVRIEHQLRYLKTMFRVDAIQFWDNNFFLGESHADELFDRMIPLGLSWWSEARIDLLLRFSDRTWRKMRAAGCKMLYLGAESGSNESLKEMSKKLTREQITELARLAQQYDIIPEFSFMFGNPRDPLGDALESIHLIHQLKEIDPRCEIILYHYTPTPQTRGSYGKVESPYPDTLEEWATPEWIRFAMHYNPAVPWLRTDLLSWLRNFETTLQCRWPTIQDFRLTPLTRKLLQGLAGWRYKSRFYHFPIELKIARRLSTLRNPRAESL